MVESFPSAPLQHHPCSRRSLLEIGTAGTLGLSLPQLLAARSIDSSSRDLPYFGKARSCIVVFLFGGPSQQDLWDLKPETSSDIRGEFSPIDTAVPGMQIGELLPHLAQKADHFTLIRSMSHRDFEHGSASYSALTGQPHPRPGTNTPARPEDFPTYGSVVSKLRPTSRPSPNFVVLGPVMHQGNRPPMAGQNAGFLGSSHEPFRIAENPNLSSFEVRSLAPAEAVSTGRFRRRQQLLSQIDPHAYQQSGSASQEGMSKLYERAFSLLYASQTQQAFDLDQESRAIREQYGRHQFGQTLLLARRLVEAEVPLITVNWSRQNRDQWDTHLNHHPKLRELLPPFDKGVSGLIEDLNSRGLLETTLVVCLGEFGRTPRINKDAGRDHWPDCYSLLITGGGIAPGQVYGASDRFAAYPAEHPVAPWDLAATVYHCLGIDPHQTLTDPVDRPIQIAQGNVVRGLL